MKEIPYDVIQKGNKVTNTVFEHRITKKINSKLFKIRNLLQAPLKKVVKSYDKFFS